MKKGWKIFWIVCAVAGIVGMICCAVSFALGVTVEAMSAYLPRGGIGWVSFLDDDDDGFWHRKADNPKYIAEDIKESYSGVREIDMEMAAGDVRVVLYDGDTVEVETNSISELLEFRSYMEEDTLKLKTKENVTGITDSVLGEIYVRIPRDMSFGEVSCDIGAGELYIEDIKATELDVNVDTGKAVVDSFYATKAGLECGVGEIEASGDVDNELDIEADIGSVTCNLSGQRTDYSYEFQCDVGTVTIDGESYDGIGFREKRQGNGYKHMDIDCGIGEVTVSFAE